MAYLLGKYTVCRKSCHTCSNKHPSILYINLSFFTILDYQLLGKCLSKGRSKKVASGKSNKFNTHINNNPNGVIIPIAIGFSELTFTMMSLCYHQGKILLDSCQTRLSSAIPMMHHQEGGECQSTSVISVCCVCGGI